MNDVKLITLGIILLILGLSASQVSAEPSMLVQVTDHFTVHYVSENPGLANSVARTAESSFLTICNSMGVRPFAGNHIYICDDMPCFRRFSPSVGESWVLGFAIPKDKRIVLKSPSLAKNSRLQFIKTLRHELSHLVLHHAVGKNHNLLPRWFDEGMAMITADQWEWFDSWSMARMVLFPIPFLSTSSTRASPPRASKHASPTPRATASASSFSTR